MSDYMESCMDFSPLFAQGNSFHIEKSAFRSKQCRNVKTVEFITLKEGRKLFFIEAKRTAPNPNNPVNKENDLEYYQDLSEKMQQSLDMILSKEVGVNIDTDGEFPQCFSETAFSAYKLIFLLVIREHERKWSDDVKQKLQRKLLAMRNIWKIEIIVLTGKEAIRKGFASRLVCKLDSSVWTGYSNCPRTACVHSQK